MHIFQLLHGNAMQISKHCWKIFIEKIHMHLSYKNDNEKINGEYIYMHFCQLKTYKYKIELNILM